MLDKLSSKKLFISDSTESTIVAEHKPIIIAVAIFVGKVAADIVAVVKHTVFAAVTEHSVAADT